MGFKVIVHRKHSCTHKLFLENGHEVKEIFGRVIADIVYLVWRDRKTVLTVLLLWSVLHYSYYTFHNIIHIREVALAVSIVKDLNGLALAKFVCKTKVRHIRTTSRTIDREEPQAR